MIEVGYDPKMSDIDYMGQVLILNKTKLEKNLNISNFDSETLKSVCNFMMIDYFDGTNIMSLLYRYAVNAPRYIVNIIRSLVHEKPLVWDHQFFTHQFKLNFFPFEPIKKIILLYLIRSNMRLLK